LNNITIAGRLGRDAELKSLADGTPVASFSVADDQGKDKPAIWWNCAIFGKRAHSLCQYLTKGTAVTVAGTVSERSYADKNGEPQKALNVRVNDLALQGQQQTSQPAPRPTQQAAPPAARPVPQASAGFDDLDDDLPF
jgi:single-strand DNA-binding protein